MKRTFQLALVGIIVSTLLLGFTFKKSKSSSFFNIIPPGTVKIDSNLYMDRQETTNFHYAEYLYWLERVFGEDSEEYTAAKIDTTVWNNYECLSAYAAIYLLHPSFREYPVVGITQEQATSFCNWRSDRIFELLLIKEKVIEPNPAQNAENYFSIQNYFSGKYNNKKPDVRYDMYPQFELPNELEWKQGKNHFDHLNHKVAKNCHKKHCKLNVQKDSIATYANYNVSPCLNDSLIEEPIKTNHCYKNQGVSFHFLGNVSEWLREENKHIGGNWASKDSSQFNSPITTAFPSEFIGFRSICRWKKYKMDS